MSPLVWGTNKKSHTRPLIRRALREAAVFRRGATRFFTQNGDMSAMCSCSSVLHATEQHLVVFISINKKNKLLASLCSAPIHPALIKLLLSKYRRGRGMFLSKHHANLTKWWTRHKKCMQTKVRLHWVASRKVFPELFHIGLIDLLKPFGSLSH